MILYRGKLAENSMQDRLIDSLKTDLYTPLCIKEPLPAEIVIDACDRLAKRVTDGEFDFIIKPFLKAYNIEYSRFREMTGLFSRESLEYKCRIELCDDESVIGGRVVRKRYPLGVLLHIAAGNVDVLPAYSVIEGLLSGNVNILKLPMGDSGLSVRILHELVLTEPELADYIYVFDVPSTETETLKKMADLCDAVVVWGGDAAVKAARVLADVDTKIIAWGHKLSFAYAECDADDKQLRALARSVCETNQLLCSSCQGIFVNTGSRDEQEKFAERFFRILLEENRRAVPIDYGMKAKNAINIYNERLEKNITGHKVLCKDGVSIIICDDSNLQLSYLYRSLWIKRLPIDDLFTLKHYKNHLQTAAVIANDPSDRKQICDILAKAGVVRITSAGAMSETISGAAHDGTYALREYSRIVETDIFDD